ncbi:hypothetical protein ACTXT7_017441 [Hymenolepis weldensis]
MEVLERAFDLSIRLNLPTVSGSTLLLIDNAPSDNLASGESSRFSKPYLPAFMCVIACEDHDAYF